VRILAAVMIALFSVASIAQTNVAAGDTVPADGVFLTNDEAAQIIAKKEAAKAQCELEKTFIADTQETKCDLQKKNLQTDLKAEKEKSSAIISLKDKELDRLYVQIEKQGGNKDGYFLAGGVTLGVVVTAIVTTLIFFAAVQTAKGESILK